MMWFKAHMVGLVTSQKPRFVDVGVRYVNGARICKGDLTCCRDRLRVGSDRSSRA